MCARTAQFTCDPSADETAAAKHNYPFMTISIPVMVGRCLIMLPDPLIFEDLCFAT
jgi:hypothetical protein